MQYRAARRATRVPATLHAGDVTLRVTLLDISRDGAKLAIPGQVARGTPVYLEIGGRSVPALVHWAQGARAGLRFYDRLDGALLRWIETTDDALAAYR